MEYTNNKRQLREKSKQNLIADFGGVALADILANGVVVLLVVIIITLSFKKQQTEQEIEQTAEISAILARDIASSLVFNDLPSSPPAILHNYECQNPRGPWRNEYEKHDCLPWLYPIIELHSSYVRELISNRIFHKSELLLENNELDTYLHLLSPEARSRIRVNIYDLDLYYLALSILKENNVRPRHWHFLGEQESSPQNIFSKDQFIDSKQTELLNATIGAEEGKGENANQEQESSVNEKSESEDAPIIPDDVNLRDADRIEDILTPGDSAGRLARGGQQRKEQREVLEQLEVSGSGDNYEDSLAQALTEAIIEERGEDNEEFGRPSSLSIRFPNMGGQTNKPISVYSFPSTPLGAQAQQEFDYHIFMILLLMEYLQRVDNLGFDRVSLQKVMDDFTSGKLSIQNHPLLNFANRLKDKMRLAFENRKRSVINILKTECHNCISRALISANIPIESLSLQAINALNYPDQTDIINLLLRLFPYPDAGEQSEILPGDIILIHPQLVEKKDKGWYPAIITDPNISDLVVGYVYAEQNSDDFYYVEGDVNSLHVEHLPLFSSLPNFPLRREIILGILYGSFTFLIIVLFFYLIGGGIKSKLSS